MTLWNKDMAASLYREPLLDLLCEAQSIHRESFDPNVIQASSLFSIKTGGCQEDCGYCAQSAHFDTDVSKALPVPVHQVREQAVRAKEAGATRFCMGAAWRSVQTKNLPYLAELIGEVKALGMEACLTAGMVSSENAEALKSAGLDFYNHNLDTSSSYYEKIVSTRRYQDRLDTINNVRGAGINVCSGGILGMGESVEDRVDLLVTLANLDPPPESVPINMLVPIPGTPLHENVQCDPLDLVRTIALARLMMPKAVIRLSAGRESLDESTQVLAFLAGANSIFIGDRLLTTTNPSLLSDDGLLRRVGLRLQGHSDDQKHC